MKSRSKQDNGMIVEMPDGSWDVLVPNKNAEEIFNFETEEEARQAYVRFQKAFGGITVEPEDVPVYEQHPMIENEYRRVR